MDQQIDHAPPAPSTPPVPRRPGACSWSELPAWLTCTQVGDLLGVHPKTVGGWVRERLVPTNTEGAISTAALVQLVTRRPRRRRQPSAYVGGDDD